MTSETLLADQLEKVVRLVSEKSGEHFRIFAVNSKKWNRRLRFDSPLEEAFHLWWLACDFCCRDYYESLGGLRLETHHEVTIDDERYVIDFVFMPNSTFCSERWTPVAVELDGHAFHERTTEQVRIRDRRDRALQKAGWKVFHYSFSEFMSEPAGCLDEVLNFVTDAMLGIIRSKSVTGISE